MAFWTVLATELIHPVLATPINSVETATSKPDTTNKPDAKRIITKSGLSFTCCFGRCDRPSAKHSRKYPEFRLIPIRDRINGTDEVNGEVPQQISNDIEPENQWRSNLCLGNQLPF